MQPELKRCPMCDRDDALYFHPSNYPGEFQVVCNANRGGCGTSGAFDTGHDGAAAKWNRRPEKRTVAYYVQGESGFYIAPKFMGRSYIPEKHQKTAVRLVEADDQ